MIVGGESGPMAREMLPQWAINIKDQCLKQNIPYFFKQWGGLNKKRNGRTLEGKEWSQMPIQN
jgi:protein gp37